MYVHLKNIKIMIKVQVLKVKVGHFAAEMDYEVYVILQAFFTQTHFVCLGVWVKMF